jgi:hypothetical protein
MTRSLVGILTVFLLVTAFGQLKADYQLGTITAVVARTNGSAELCHQLRHFPPGWQHRLCGLVHSALGARTLQYAAGSELLVKLGAKTIIFNDMLGESLEVPIIAFCGLRGNMTFIPTQTGLMRVEDSEELIRAIFPKYPSLKPRHPAPLLEPMAHASAPRSN